MSDDRLFSKKCVMCDSDVYSYFDVETAICATCYEMDRAMQENSAPITTQDGYIMLDPKLNDDLEYIKSAINYLMEELDIMKQMMEKKK